MHVDDKVRRYLLKIIHGTRENEDFSLGASPRASIALFRAAQSMAALRGRNFVQPDDVKRVCGPVLTHRIILKPESRLRRVVTEEIIQEIVADVAVPTMSKGQGK